MTAAHSFQIRSRGASQAIPVTKAFKTQDVTHHAVQPGAILLDRAGHFYDVREADYKTRGYRFLCVRRGDNASRWVALSSILCTCELVVMK